MFQLVYKKMTYADTRDDTPSIKCAKMEKKNLKKKICIFPHYCIFRIRKRICISIWIFERWGCFASVWFLLNNKISRERERAAVIKLYRSNAKSFLFSPKSHKNATKIKFKWVIKMNSMVRLWKFLDESHRKFQLCRMQFLFFFSFILL